MIFINIPLASAILASYSVILVYTSPVPENNLRTRVGGLGYDSGLKKDLSFHLETRQRGGMVEEMVAAVAKELASRRCR